MNNKTYLNNGAEYKIKPITLGVLKFAAPVIAEFRKLQYKYTKDINFTPVEGAKKKISELELGVKQLEELLNDSSISDAEKSDAKSRLNTLNEKLTSAKSEFTENVSLQQLIKLYNECTGLAVMELISDEKLIFLFLSNILESVNNKNDKIDFTNSIDAGFVREVIRDFFYCMAQDWMRSGS